MPPSLRLLVALLALLSLLAARHLHRRLLAAEAAHASSFVPSRTLAGGASAPGHSLFRRPSIRNASNVSLRQRKAIP